MRRRLLLAISLSALAAPTAAPAAVITFGSDLSATPTIAHSNRADSGFWHTGLADRSAAAVPEGGQILEIKVKGVALTAPDGRRPDAVGPQGGGIPSNLIHFQTLKPQPDGTMKVDVTSGNFYMPFDVPESTVTTFRPENLCAAKGDSIDFSGIGGWDGSAHGSTGHENGVPYKIFASTAGSSFTQFFKDNGFQNGSVLVDGYKTATESPMPAPELVRGQELLMQLTLGTGPDAVFHCPGGTSNPYRPADPAPSGGGGTSTGGSTGSTPAPAGPPATIPAGKSASINKKGVVSIGVHCGKAGACAGGLVLKSGRTVMAKGRYAIPAGKTAGVKLKLTKAGKKLFKRRKQKMTATAIATSDPGGASNVATGKVKLKRRGA